MILSELPSYLTDELGFDLESAGLLAIAPYLANFIGVIVFGHYFHKFQETHLTGLGNGKCEQNYGFCNI